MICWNLFTASLSGNISDDTHVHTSGIILLGLYILVGSDFYQIKYLIATEYKKTLQIIVFHLKNVEKAELMVVIILYKRVL